jgi:transcriptional regulator with XRE-family HTH domain
MPALILEASGFAGKMRAVMPSIHSQRSKIFCAHIRELRDKVGMTQRDLAAALGREHGMVARIELGERRVDMVEAFDIFLALKADPAKEAASLMRKFAAA